MAWKAPCLAFSVLLVVASTGAGQAESEGQSQVRTLKDMTDHPYLGVWVTRDGFIRQELLPNGRYDEARGSRRSAYQGRYEIRGDRIEYWDDTGFTADGEFINDVLHHGGMLFYREKQVE